MELRIALLPGDGVGPEVVIGGVKALEAVAKKFNRIFEFKRAKIGAGAFEEGGEALPVSTIETCKACDAVLFGAVGDPKYERPNVEKRPELGYGIIRLRRILGLFANIRPVRPFPSIVEVSRFKKEAIEGVDLIVLRELTGGIYYAEPKMVFNTCEGRRAVDTTTYSEGEIRRILRVGFELARRRRKKLTSVDKFQILRCSDLWREVANETASEYPDVILEHALVDSCAMRLILQPQSFDVVVTENLFGDILSDEASMLTGSLGMIPSASLGEAPAEGKKTFGLYEPIHGSAPDIAGLNAANPIGTILSAALMLRFSFGFEAEAQKIEEAVDHVLEEGYRPADIMSPGKRETGTQEMSEMVANRILSD
jgi:3-isopropylmalate dehydrogenase